jgi:hypothetical protein
MTLGTFLDRHSIQNFVGAKLFQSRRQNIARNPKATLEFFETPGSEKSLADNQDRPAFPIDQPSPIISSTWPTDRLNGSYFSGFDIAYDLSGNRQVKLRNQGFYIIATRRIRQPTSARSVSS